MTNLKIVSKAEFARMARVSGPAVTQLCATRLAPALVGKRIDAAHPVAVAYLESKTTDRPADRETPAAPAPEPEKKPRGWAARNKAKQEAEASLPPVEVPENLEEFADLTLRQIVERFGTDVRFSDYLKSMQAIETIIDKRLRNAERAGTLINRELVRRAFVDVFDSAHRRLLTDGARNLAAAIDGKAKAGASPAEIEAHISDVLGSFIKPAKSKVARALRELES